MELYASRAFSNLPHQRIFSTNSTHLPSKTSLPLKKTAIFHRNSGSLYFATPLLRATTSEETSTGVNQQFEEVPDGVITTEETSMDEQMQFFGFLDKLNIKLDLEDTYPILLYGSGGLAALWLASAIVGAIDSIPVFPKVMEVVGLAFTIWFSYRYLIFKENRDELVDKIEEFKQQVLGSTDD
ncbi:hypothetical protein HHK36_003935 [Tetracentron sinense]|uniref:Cyanobacterial aminoacyl-tRNA synthetase CAAD domain-containing protein n=1 Tax=Tetracentron sinense TaxID=13715 RepID=A0A834ZQ88_TETSI|nr:hypothetical protein HHK36_003935 [Tetracentron sinense]